MIIGLVVISIGWIGAYLLLRTYSQRMEGTEYDFSLPEEFARLQPLFAKTGPPQPGEWLAKHPERGQTYQEYLHSVFRISVPPGSVIYVQPLGKFSPGQKEILNQAADFIGDYFALPVQMSDSLPLGSLPDSARRQRDSEPGEQLQTYYLIDNVLKPQKPEDAYIVMGFIASDIWPGGDGNFVYGQANETDRIAICSLARICSDKSLSEDRALCLRRTLKTSSHEICHLFAMMHCPWYLCNAAGCNNLAEMDRHPLELCPQCLAKICSATGADPARRFEKLRDFYKQNGLGEEEIFCTKLLSALQGR
ncbi:MAG: archaemetzincin [Thermoguttaceae bacterium]